MSKEDRKPPKNHYIIKIMKGYNIHFQIIILLELRLSN